MKRPPMRFTGSAGVVVATLIAAVAVTVAPSVAFSAEVSTAPSGAWIVDGRGNGHGHGLSQYGARGAAIAGLSSSKIVAFYYPGTTLTAQAVSSIRVRITDQGQYTTLRAASGLTVTGVSGYLPTSGISRWRLVPSGSGLALQRYASGWQSVKTGLPSSATFRSSTGVVRLYHGDGSSTDYRGTISAVRSGSGEITTNRLSLDDYVRGVIPREMPASWPAAAVQSQAIAARTYARYGAVHGGSGVYDVCDTTNCQVYGGKMRYDSAGNAVYGEDTRSNAAVAATANKVLTYRGAVAFTQFSASNGGVMAAGGQPYLVSKVDPYDNAASGDPYLDWTRSVSTSRVADNYGLARVTELDINSRAGGGAWGGVVVAATIRGTDSSGTARSVQTSGAGLASAMGLPYSLFHVRSAATTVTTAPVGRVDSVKLATLHSVRVTGWTFDPAHTETSTRVHVYVDATGHGFDANLVRVDVQRAYTTGTAAHGYSAVVPIPPTGNHRLCVYGLDVSTRHRTTLGCSYVSAPVSPLGAVDSVTSVGTSFRVAGWTFDPDRSGGPGRLRVVVDASVRTFSAVAVRADVARRYTLRNDTVGFHVTVAVPAGLHRICSYGVNIAGAGHDVSLGCVTVRH